MGKIIWYFHPYAGSPSIGMAYRPYFLAKNFEIKGHKTFIVSSSFHHFLHKKNNISKNTLECIDLVNFFWIKNIAYQGNGFKRLLNMLIYSFKLLGLLKPPKALVKPNVIIASSPHLFHVWSAYILAKRFKAKFIVEIRDIWPDSLIQISNISKYHPTILVLKLLEYFAYKKADYIVSVLPRFDKYLKKYNMEHKFHYIPNGIDIVAPKIDSANNLYQEISMYKDHFLLLYSGAIGSPNALDQLIMAMNVLKNTNNKIIAIIIGEGTEKDKFIAKIKEQHMDNVKFYSRISHDVLQSILVMVDCTYIGWLNLPIYNYGVSANKIFEYMLAKKPIIQSASMIVDLDLIQNSNCGITVPANSPELLAQAILQMSQVPKTKREQMGMSGKEYVQKYHNYALLAAKYTYMF